MNEFKIIFLGSSGAGAKTSLINRIIGRKFNENETSTNSASYASKIIKTSYGEIMLTLWDTAGQEKYRPLIRHFCRDLDCVVFGYGVNNRDDLDEIQDFYQMVYKELGNLPLLYLVGNKIDLYREVTKEEGENYAKSHNMKYYEVSAKTGEGVNELIEDISNSLEIKKNKYFEKNQKLNYYYNY